MKRTPKGEKNKSSLSRETGNSSWYDLKDIQNTKQTGMEKTNHSKP